MHIGDYRRSAREALLKVILAIDDLSLTRLPFRKLALCSNPEPVAIQRLLPDFDAQGLKEGTGDRALGMLQIAGTKDDDDSARGSGGTAWDNGAVLRFEAAAAAERAKIDREHDALLEEREQLEATHNQFDALVRAARSAHEQTLSCIEREQTTLDEAHREAVAE
ncbi:hypothetical protein E2562_014287 [Oryza meyeriana var. granulata]|uniref:Uncharacterized protein n=1 Tax=Oryza meyeriana var. granulata TaxID=110450 RepID=A0A6G1C5D3_9ORYZ|nr:hypothetical protein E2562_014287 [Oryza meyeriana var. granulata]